MLALLSDIKTFLDLSFRFILHNNPKTDYPLHMSQVKKSLIMIVSPVQPSRVNIHQLRWHGNVNM